MKFTLEIDLANDAFQPQPHDELHRIVQLIADALTVPCPLPGYVPLLDSNGNTVGTMEVK
jgi:hypothetical protein